MDKIIDGANGQNNIPGWASWRPDGRKWMQKSIRAGLFSVNYNACAKVQDHKDECSAIWIYEEWQQQPLPDFNFVKFWAFETLCQFHHNESVTIIF